MDQELFLVQFFPCGHVYYMRPGEIIDLMGEGYAERHEARYLDAPTIPSRHCDYCKDDLDVTNRENERADLGLFDREMAVSQS